MIWVSFAAGAFAGFMLGFLLVSLLVISRERAVPVTENLLR